MQNFFNKIKKILLGKNGHLYTLAFLMMLGIFLRTYNFANWLYFYPDQARDVTISERVLSGEESWPLLGPIAASTPFKLGPIYYYFQIISAKIFGSSPWSMAYPDLLFGILAIPLLYYFLKRYFSLNSSLVLTGLFSISFYAIRYSRFAWNSNPIPFFVLLFLLALLEFMFTKEKTNWKWIVSIGIALGVGVQLHTVLLILMPVTLLAAFVFLWNNNGALWKKWATIFLIAIFLNTGQFVSELKSGFGNTKDFLSVLNDRSPSENSGMAGNFLLDIVCHSQANVLFLSSLENNDSCDSLSYLRYSDSLGQASNTSINFAAILNIFGGFILLGCGYSLLFFYVRKEKDEKKKIFLGLNIAYGLLAFLIILPIIGHNGQVRYWLPIIFLPFLFFGLILKYLKEEIQKKYHWLGIVAIILLILLNFSTIFDETDQLVSKTRSNAQYVVFGELQDINHYIMSQSFPQKEAYVFGGQKYLQNFYKPLFYEASKNDFTIIRGGRHPEEIPKGSAIFYIGNNPNSTQVSKYQSDPSEVGFEIKNYKAFGNIIIYKLGN